MNSPKYHLNLFYKSNMYIFRKEYVVFRWKGHRLKVVFDNVFEVADEKMAR